MQPEEARHLGRLTGLALGGVARRAYELHSAIAGRVFDALGPPAAPVRVVHDGIAGVAYHAVSGGLGASGWISGEVAARRVTDPQRVVDHPVGRRVLGFVNGAHGDLLARDYPSLALPMTVRACGRDVDLTPAGLAAAYPTTGPRVAIFLHGLVETEDSWQFRAERRHGDATTTYGSLLERDLGYTPVMLRYNSGLRISDNGRALAALLTELTGSWPVPLEEVVLIGHSMGGLVARSALAQAGDGTAAGERHWPGLVRSTITLGAPQLGAPLEQRVNALGHALNRVGETRWLGTLLAHRSVGIKDLRFGNLVEADWVDAEIDARTSSRTDIPLHAGARHFVVLATVASRHDGPAAALLGDLLVRPQSALGDTGDERRLAYEREHVLRLGGLHHLDLLNHPRVYEQLRAWMAERPEAKGPGASRSD